jgi:signal transduction histidine kinase
MRLTRLPARTRLGNAAVIAVAALGVVALGILQYRWNRDASEATGVRLADALQISIVNWHLDLFRNLSEVSLTMRAPAPPEEESAAAARRRVREWRARARYPDLVHRVFLVGRDGVEPVVPDETGAPPVWTPALQAVASVLRRDDQPGPVIPDRSLTESFYNIGSALREWRFEPSLPALVRTVTPGTTWLLVQLDEPVLREHILPDLAHRYFQGLDGLDYDVAVVARGNGRRVLYSSAPGFAEAEVADADARMDIFATAGPTLQIFHRTSPNNGPTAAVGVSWFPLLQGGGDLDWQLVVRHRRGGSLGQFVLAMSRRGLAVSYGALALLVLSMSMLVVTGIRVHRLGRLQMDFVTAVSHELRTPLTVIASAADNLHDGVIESQTQLHEYGAIISREVGTLSGLVERILLFVATRDGRHQYHLEAVDVREVIDGVLTRTDPLIRAAGVTVECRIEPDLPMVLADRIGLDHCLENLVTNALKYGAHGADVRIDATIVGQPAERIAIAVTDRGPGISPDDLPHLFEPFYRGRGARVAQIHGTGIGLALARQVVVAMGGSLEAANVPGGGATFTIRLKPA